MIRTAAWLGIVCVGFVSIGGGCIEILQAIGPNTPGEDGGGDEPDLPSDGGGSGDASITAVLRVSNATPTVGESVILVCRPDPSDAEVTAYAFQSNDNRFQSDAATGLARFIVDSSDVGSEITATCTVTTSRGTSEASNRVTILPGL